MAMHLQLPQTTPNYNILLLLTPIQFYNNPDVEQLQLILPQLMTADLS
jgi:hypothetical protein